MLISCILLDAENEDTWVYANNNYPNNNHYSHRRHIAKDIREVLLRREKNDSFFITT